jgi:porphobilinogen deaminase
VHARMLKIEAMVADREGSQMIKISYEGNAVSPQQAGQNLARSMIEAGAASLIKDTRCR